MSFDRLNEWVYFKAMLLNICLLNGTDWKYTNKDREIISAQDKSSLFLATMFKDKEPMLFTKT